MAQPTDLLPRSAFRSALRDAGTRETLRVLVTVKKRSWCGELYSIALGVHGLAERGHHVVVAHNVGSDVVSRIDSHRVRTVELDMRRGTTRLVPTLKTVRALRRLMREERIDVVETHASWDHWLCAYAGIGPHAAPPLVRIRHNRKRIARHVANWWLYARATRAFATQTYSVRDDILETAFVDRERLHVIGSAMDFERFRPNPDARRRVRAAFGVPSDARVLGYVGRLTRRKRPERLLETFRRVARIHPRARLVVVGWGDPVYQERMRSAAANDERIVYAGRRDDPEDFYPEFDTFLLPSYAESFPRTALEAMACGVPTVSGPESGLAGFVTDRETGRVLQSAEASELAGAVAWLWDRPDVAEAMGRKGRELVLGALSPASYVLRLEALLSSAVGRVRIP